jgi:hypothetical protein
MSTEDTTAPPAPITAEGADKDTSAAGHELSDADLDSVAGAGAWDWVTNPAPSNGLRLPFS